MSVTTEPQTDFFITRQSATIIESLSQRLLSPGTICLLHGNPGVGKTRMLQELRRRLDPIVPVHSWRAEDGKSGLLNGHDVAACSPTTKLESLPASLSSGAVILLDQLEHFSPENLQRFLQVWANLHGEDTPSLLLSCNSAALHQVRDLPREFSEQISVVALHPLSLRESREYWELQIGGLAKLKALPRTERRKLMRQLRETQGLFNKLEEVVASSKICAKNEANLTQRFFARIVVPASLIPAAIVSLAVVWEYGINAVGIKRSGATLELPVYQSQATVGIETNTVQGQTSDDSIALLVGAPKFGNGATTITQQAQAEFDVSRAGGVETSRQGAEFKEVDPSEEASAGVLEQRLNATARWLSQQADQIASIQIMTLTASSSAEQAMTRYLEKLEKHGVDLDQVFVYQKALGQSRKIYGVLYGTYRDSRQATMKLAGLVPVLAENKPFPRTLKGLRKEISSG